MSCVHSCFYYDTKIGNSIKMYFFLWTASTTDPTFYQIPEIHRLSSYLVTVVSYKCSFVSVVGFTLLVYISLVA